MDFLYETKNIWEGADEETKANIQNFSQGYKAYLTRCVNERICVQEAERLAVAAGFVNIKEKSGLQAGDKIYAINRKKNILLATVGSLGSLQGVNLIASHIDVPRLDLKPVPLFEEDGLSYFKTHYYGGIKKYQWTTIPLALCGVVATKDGIVDISIGLDPEDPVFTISDLLPHLAQEQMQKKASEFVEGEKLNILIGSIPADCEKSKLKQAVMNILNAKYGITEEDFISSEIEVVPAFPAKDIGLDKSMVGGYGQDDRVCAYTSLQAALEIHAPMRTAVTILVDKEEIGSMGNTGIQSQFYQSILSEILQLENGNYSDLDLRRCLSASCCLSADVAAAYDPAYPGVYEKKNTPFLGGGIVVTKYTGSRGKSGSSDAGAEFAGFVRSLLNEKHIAWQTGELGKVDAGGGGTVAQFIANSNVDVIDCGVALLSMHSPFEISSKADVYMAYRAYKAFLGSHPQY